MTGWRRRLLVVAAMVGLIGVTAGGVPALRADADAVMYQVADERAAWDGVELLQQQGCAYGATITDGNGQPLVGVTVAVVETGVTAQTDATGRYQVTVPGPGTWTIRASRDGFLPRLERILFGPGCVLLSSMDISGSPPSPSAGTPRPTQGRTPTPARTPTATPTPSLNGAVRLTGTLTIEGRSAAAGTTLQAMIGETVCGLARTNAQGRYSMDVASDAATPGCGVSGADVQIVVTPGFGSGWYVGGELRFQPNAAMQRDLTVDLRKLPADPFNVPWNGSFWTDTESIPIGVCAEVSPEAEEAIQGAFAQWYQANRMAGLRYDLFPDGDAACGTGRAGIGFIHRQSERQSRLRRAGRRSVAGRRVSPDRRDRTRRR
ncbi:MAG: carboxypeptidase regulatory-like domain-containing protein [Chloroflexi bacterium]|nr:carboxypeptidase regulatory-like domain-containing protein [Chloroflexota bacterium]